MRHPIRVICYLAIPLLAAGRSAAATETTPSPVLKAMKEELARSMQTLGKQPTPPYFLSYEITELHSLAVESSFGKLVRSDENRHRYLDIDLRVGSYSLDNTRPFRGGYPAFDFLERAGMAEVPVDDDPDAIRAALWYDTSARYKHAVQQLTQIKTNVQVKVEQEDKSADFSPEPAEKFYQPPVTLNVDRHAWEEKIRQYTAPFARYANLYEATATFSVEGETRWYVNSEGSEVQTSQPNYRLFISAFTKAEDGMELPRYESFLASTPEGLPDTPRVLAAVDKMIKDLQALRTAPIVDPYAGPAMLSGRASGVFFHEVFGHRVEGQRQKEESQSQTFKKMVNQKVLPEGFSVYFDPTLRRLSGQDLVGFYEFDNQGVKARRVTVVENGVLKNFLMSRTPIDGFPHSNGHGRKQAGAAPVARQSNLLVEVAHPVSHAQLKQMLIEQIKKDNKPFGLFFDDIEGGFTLTGRTIPNAFNVLPVMVYRIFADGREELVRGVDLIGTPLTAFSKILAGDDHVAVFNGICGAESGSVPVSASSPALLISQVEVQKKEKSQERPPILSSPLAGQQ